MNRYTVVIKKLINGKESNKFIPMFIDKEDYEEAKKYKWRVDRYVKTRVNKKHFLLHYLVLERKKGLEIDHINHNIFDNRRQNLRYVTKSQNQWNQKSKGYSWDKNKLKWRVSLKVNYKTIHLGYYKDEKDAQIARLNGEKKYFREYAYKLK